MQLVKPSINLKGQYIDFYNEWEFAGEKLNPGVLRKLNPSRFEEVVKVLQAIECTEYTPEGFVPQTVLWLIDVNNRIFGAVTIRHALTKRMLNTEGHIGAGIRPSERGKGYGTKILELALDEMREMGFQKALVTCNEDNFGSEKAIIKNGGVRDKDFLEKHGNTVRRYWITL